MTGSERAGSVAGPPLPALAAPWSVRVARSEGDVALIHDWMHRPHVEQFWQQAWSRQRWQDEIATQLAGWHSLPCLVAMDGADIAYLEVYRVARDRLAGYYPHYPHDLGVHIAIGERGRTGRGVGRTLLTEVATALLRQDERCLRVVAEPDSANEPSVAAFAAAGFRSTGTIALPEKVATLMVCTRDGDGAG